MEADTLFYFVDSWGPDGKRRTAMLYKGTSGGRYMARRASEGAEGPATVLLPSISCEDEAGNILPPV